MLFAYTMKWQRICHKQSDSLLVPCVHVCLSDAQIRYIHRFSPPVRNPDGREEEEEEGGRVEAAAAWPSLLCVCFGAGG